MLSKTVSTHSCGIVTRRSDHYPSIFPILCHSQMVHLRLRGCSIFPLKNHISCSTLTATITPSKTKRTQQKSLSLFSFVCKEFLIVFSGAIHLEHLVRLSP